MDYSTEQLITDVEIVNREMKRCGLEFAYSIQKCTGDRLALDRTKWDRGWVANIVCGTPEKCAKIMYVDAFYVLSKTVQTARGK